jgi:hypothetical protein
MPHRSDGYHLFFKEVPLTESSAERISAYALSAASTSISLFYLLGSTMNTARAPATKWIGRSHGTVKALSCFTSFSLQSIALP